MEVKWHLGKDPLHLLVNRWQITIFGDKFVFIDKEILMLLRKCLILLALFSFSAVPMMGCTPSAENTDTETEEDTTNDTDPGGENGDDDGNDTDDTDSGADTTDESDPGTDDETETGNNTNTD